MLYLEAPLHIIDGVSVFRDHADPLQWYYLPIGPRLTTVADATTGTQVPQLQVIKFRGEAGSGGFLNFDVDLGIDPDQLDAIATELKKREHLTDRPRLAPVPLVDGTVRLMLFDRESGDPAADAASKPFVLTIDHSAKPALYGDNRAAFSVQLSERGVTILEQALRGEMSPIGVVYSLDFLALRPAYHVQLHVDWSRVQNHLEEHFSVSIPVVFQADIDKIVDKLIEDRAIVLEVDTFVPEGEESSGILSRRDDAVNDVRDMITETFFKPSLDPMPRQDERDKDLGSAGRIVQMIASGGAVGGSPMFSYSKLEATRIDQKRLDVDMRERTTVKRSIFPQGHLAGLFRVLRDGGVDIDRFVLSVDTDDPWFARRKLQVIGRADFVNDAITSIDVRLDYGGEPRNVLLDAAHPTVPVEWASRLDGGVMRRDVATHYTVTFADADASERPLSLTSAERTVSVDNLEIVPRELYSVVPVPIVALDFPWARYPHVQVQTRYRDPDNGIRQDDDFLLASDKPEATWKMFVRAPERTRFEYKIICRAADHQDREGPWVETDEERIVVRDPFPSKLAVAVVPVLDWTKTDRAFVDLTYRDEANGIHEQKSLEFRETNTATQEFRVSLKDPQRRLVEYRISVVQKDGSLIEVPTSFTLDSRIMVRADTKGHRIVEVRPAANDFGELKLRDVTVDARYQDASNGLTFADTFTFHSPADRAHFEYDFVHGGPTGFEYRVVRRYTNGMTRESDWTLSAAGDVTVPLA